MDPLHGNSAQLAMASERLEAAVAALETRIVTLKSRADTGGAPLPSDYQALLDELEAIKGRERDLEAAAMGAFEALGIAAAQIRMIIATETL